MNKRQQNEITRLEKNLDNLLKYDETEIFAGVVQTDFKGEYFHLKNYYPDDKRAIDKFIENYKERIDSLYELL